MARVRFAPSPTGSLHLGGALSAVANRRFADEHGGSFLLRIDDTDQVRNVEGGADAIASDLEWLGVQWDEGPMRQSERHVRHREAAHLIGEPDSEGALRFGQTTLLRPDGTPTYQLASAVDDVDFEITHVIRGSDHRANAELQAALIRALGAEPPEYIHHGLLLGEDGTKLSKRHGASSLADLRDEGIPPEAVRAYLEELGLPRGVDEAVAVGAQHRGRDVDLADPVAAVESRDAARGFGEHAHVVTAHLGGRPRQEAGGPLRAHPTQRVRAGGRNRGKVARHPCESGERRERRVRHPSGLCRE